MKYTHNKPARTIDLKSLCERYGVTENNEVEVKYEKPMKYKMKKNSRGQIVLCRGKSR